jgi:hypothetical protein
MDEPRVLAMVLAGYMLRNGESEEHVLSTLRAPGLVHG